MNQFMLHRNLSIDHMTGLKNFIQFIEEDYEETFGDAGIICLFDIAGLQAINERYGREVGDQAIRTATNVLLQNFDRKNLYRTEGDAFTIVMKGASCYGMESLLEESANHYHALMKEKGYPDFYLHHVYYQYDESITSVEDYYLFIMRSEGEFDLGHKFSGEAMLRHILTGVVNRFRQSIEQYGEVCDYALYDEISGLPNAKAANQYLGSMTTNTLRRTDKYCVLFIDGDDLRRYNDISYQAGNQMIRNLGQILKEAIRDNDKIFRWLSGDEFIVILEDTDTIAGEMLAERIRKAVESHREEFVFNTTVSIGVASYPNDGRDVDTVIYYAEKANKLAKDQGKNLVVSWRDVDVAAL